MHKLFEHIKFEENPDDDPLTILVRYFLYKLDCMYGLSECQAKVTAKLLAYVEDPNANEPSPDQEFMYCFGLIKANESFWDLFLQAQERLKSHMWFLGCSENLHIIERHINFSSEYLKTNTNVDNYYLFILENMLERLPNIDVAIEYFINNYNKIAQDTVDNPFILHTLEGSIIRNSFRQDQIDKMKAFAEQHSTHQYINMRENLNKKETLLAEMKYNLSIVRSALENRQFVSLNSDTP